MECEAIKKKVADYCAGRPEIVACYLFGSYAGGKERQGSDVDVAFLLDASVSRSHYFDLKLVYHNGLARLLRLDIHPVIMNDAGEVLLEQIFGKGIAVFNRDPLELSRFRAIRFSMIAEFAPYRNRMEEALFRKYKEDPAHG
ncbi:MAG: DNA polymerase subunit [Geobacteraceae bacterium]|nr:MAG: DNA polymerase subunit [Geobacteraceae bacterium]